VKITVLGNADSDQWFAHRLAARGFDVAPAAPPSPEQGIVAGLLADRIVVDTGPGSIDTRHQRAEHCRRTGWGYAEMAGPWQPLGQQFGFPLFVGADTDTRAALTPLFDALAPQAGAWLPCGPAASGRFAAQIFNALTMACALACQAGWSTPGQTLHTPDWGAFFLQQRTLADKLLALSQRYLALYPDDAATDDPWQQLAAFSQPPRQQPHFSASLARLIVLALTQSEAQQAILSKLMTGATG